MGQERLPLGQLLTQVGLLSQGQLDLVLRDQEMYGAGLRLGEILALRGWVKQETCDFFAVRWSALKMAVQQGQDRRKLGEYLREAHLLDGAQVEDILLHQRGIKLPFGKIAVAKGYLKQETLDFFLQHLQINHYKNKERIAGYINRAQRDLQHRDLAGAIIELRAALKINPHHAKCHALLAKAYALQNQVSLANAHFKLARVHLKQAMRLNPKDTVIHEFYSQEDLQVYCFSQERSGHENNVEAKPVVLGDFWQRMYQRKAALGQGLEVESGSGRVVKGVAARGATPVQAPSHNVGDSQKFTPAQTKELIDKLLLEAMSLTAIARVCEISEDWLQFYLRQQYVAIPRDVMAGIASYA